MLSPRFALVAPLVLATIGFVIGTSVERHDEHHESAAHVKAERSASPSEPGEATVDTVGGE